jgi:hypothetical protein
MTLQELISTLSPRRKLGLAIQFVQKSQSIWNDYAANNKLTYIDTVVGMFHEVKPDLPERSLDAAVKEFENPGSNQAEIKSLLDEFLDPIVAMQDDDWEIPDEVEKTFYATYNLLEALTGKEITIFNEEYAYLVINQAIDAITTVGLMTQDEVNAWATQYGHRAE